MWTNIAIVLERNGNGTHSTMRLYKDGELLGENTQLVANLSTMGPDLKAYLGKSFYSDPYFKGSYDNVRVYNRALTDEQVRQVFDQKPVTPPANASEMKTMIYRLAEDGEIASDDVVHSLQVHLTVVDRFEKQAAADKVIKHMQNFKLLLDYQKENRLISNKTYDILFAAADSLIKKWQ